MSAPPRRLSFALLATCFFGSGLTALIYELLWTRRLGLTFGSTTYSVTTVLAAFMAGLGLGSYLVGRRVDRSRLGGVRIYAYLELGVGICALASLPLLSAVEWLYAALQSWLQLGQGGAAVLKLVLAFPVLALPAGLMGGTLPALVRGLLESRATLHTTVGRLYGINTAGAAVGTALAGIVMIEHLGLWRSMVLSALVNLGIAAVVLTRLGRSSRATAEPEPTDDVPEVHLRTHLRSPPVLFCAVAVVLTGMLSMLYEVVWTRLLSLVMGSSTYAFTIVLSIFLLGLAVGALIYGRRSQRRPPTVFGLTLVLLALALWAALTLVAIPSMPHLMVLLGQIPGASLSRVLLFEGLCAAFVLLVPTLLLGAALPMAMGIISRAIGQVGRDVGGVYLANTFGAILGSVLTGFVLVPGLGSQTTLVVGLVANLVLVGYGVLTFGRTLQLKVAGCTVVLLMAVPSLFQPAWPSLVFDSGLGYRLEGRPASSKRELVSLLYRSPNRLLFHEEGRNATITVRRYPNGMSLLVNGKPDASTAKDMLTQVLLGVVGTMSHPRPEKVGVVGWGSGVTAYTVTFFPEVQQIDVIEIEPAVVRATTHFHGVNGQVERNGRVRPIFDDARSYLLTTDQRYDVIISEPSNPWMAGVANLFSLDYYRLAGRKLRPGGVFAQWLQLYHIEAESVALVLRTFLAAFPHVQLWASDPNNVILLGSDRPIQVTYERVKRAYRGNAPLRRHMAVYGPGIQPEHFYGCYLLGRQALTKMARRFPSEPEVVTDDRPVLEYRAIRGLYARTHRHAQALWRAKIAANEVLPAGHGGAPPGLALAGAGKLYRDLPPLAAKVTAWGMKRFSAEPQLRLARAKALFYSGQLDKAAPLLKGLPDDPGYRTEAALLDARILLKQRRPLEALRRLDEMGHFRPTARRVYQLQSALAAGQLALAWTFAEEVVRRLTVEWDLDVRSLHRSRLYDQIAVLAERSRQYDRAVRLLASRQEPYDGEYNRLRALAQAHWGAGSPRQAAKILDEVLAYGLGDLATLELCTKVYKATKDQAAVEACQQLLDELQEKPRGKSLWD
jgi:spermidine synthase